MIKPITTPVKFLLVDDREDNLTVLEALLEREGLEILKARSGEEALELLLAHDVALALLDVQMPEMDGFALAELMRGSERTRHVPIIFVTAGTQDQHRLFRGYDAGAVDFLFKPIEPRILRHKAETFFQLYKQKHELAETLHLNETFVAAVGHDLKNPLNAIMGASQIILAHVTDPIARRNAERVESSSRRMARMIDDLFDLARARLGSGIPIECKEIDLAVVCRRAIVEHEAVNSTNAISLRMDGDTKGIWDADRLAQVVSNLLGNAARHGEKGTAIDVLLKGDAENVCLSVHNKGAIARDVLPHIFDPFRSNQEKRSRAEGLGLGLYIVHQVVSAHGGRIDVRSAESEGTTFVVRLPRHSAAKACSV